MSVIVQVRGARSRGRMSKLSEACVHPILQRQSICYLYPSIAGLTNCPAHYSQWQGTILYISMAPVLLHDLMISYIPSGVLNPRIALADFTI